MLVTGDLSGSFAVEVVATWVPCGLHGGAVITIGMGDVNEVAIVVSYLISI